MKNIWMCNWVTKTYIFRTIDWFLFLVWILGTTRHILKIGQYSGYTFMFDHD